MATLYDALAGDPARAAALDADFLRFATSANRGTPGGPAELEFTYLLVTGRVRAEGR